MSPYEGQMMLNKSLKGFRLRASLQTRSHIWNGFYERNVASRYEQSEVGLRDLQVSWPKPTITTH